MGLGHYYAKVYSLYLNIFSNISNCVARCCLCPRSCTCGSLASLLPTCSLRIGGRERLSETKKKKMQVWHNLAVTRQWWDKPQHHMPLWLSRHCSVFTFPVKRTWKSALTQCFSHCWELAVRNCFYFYHSTFEFWILIGQKVSQLILFNSSPTRRITALH